MKKKFPLFVCGDAHQVQDYISGRGTTIANNMYIGGITCDRKVKTSYTLSHLHTTIYLHR